MSGHLDQVMILSSIQFVSRDKPDTIFTGYKKQRGKGWKYLPEIATKQLGEIGVFVITEKATMDAMRSQQIRIAKVEKPEDTGFITMTFDVTGVKAMINIQIKPIL